LKKILKRLNEPFPEYEDPKRNLYQTIGVGIFITLFLYFFQVGGVNNSRYNFLLVCINFGLITIAVSLLFEWIVTKVFKIKRNIPSWTLGKWIVWVFILLIFISLGNYAYFLYLSDISSPSWTSYIEVVISTIMIGIFPVVFSGLLLQINAIKRNQIQASQLQSHFPKNKTSRLKQTEILEITSNNKSPNFSAPINDIYYLESMQNYVSIVFKKENQFKKEMVRNTIKNVEDQLENTPLIRCHRSFIVNKELIEAIDGNAQGLKLKLKELEEFEVPVSRKYIPILRQK